MTKLPAGRLAEKYELEPGSDLGFFEYILQSFDNGVKTQAFRLFTEMNATDRERFTYYCLYSVNRPEIPAKFLIKLINA